MLNFNRPYLAVNPSDFWRRWHISLSTWLRDYLYIPLGGNRGGWLTTYRNLLVTMLLGGLWHGAAWNFVLWGLFHGVLLIGHRLIVDEWRVWRVEGRLARLISQVVMFHLVCYGWLLFRATSFSQIRAFTRSLLVGLGGFTVSAAPVAMLITLVAMVWSIDFWVKNADDPSRSPSWHRGLGALACAVLSVAIVTLSPPGTHSFIYFQF
jgi:D-alanyl-lipoteichoic acid acyltransferase DltB (MBOAT superfamily)